MFDSNKAHRKLWNYLVSMGNKLENVLVNAPLVYDKNDIAQIC